MKKNWIVILDSNTVNPQIYRIKDTHYSIVEGWANQNKNLNGIVIFAEEVIELPENNITISVQYHAI